MLSCDDALDGDVMGVAAGARHAEAGHGGDAFLFCICHMNLLIKLEERMKGGCYAPP
jgi:hypothetical protein